jgi:transposase
MATRAEWMKRVKRWERSGLDAAEFAQREGLKAKQLYWWKWKLGAAGAQPEPAAPRFLPVRVVEPSPPPTPASTVPPAPAPTAPPAPAWIDITLPNGSLVRVMPGVDAATLACVMTVVAEMSC